jgi:hypothetical protein
VGTGLIELRIPEAVPSANSYLWKHWSAKLAHRKRWAWLVRVARLDSKLMPEKLQQANVCIDRYGNRKLDHDNFVGGAKALMDALVAEGYLEDDSPDHVNVTYRQHKGKPEHTVVTIL